MVINRLRLLRDALDKKRLGIDEDFPLADHLTAQPYEVRADPFPHVVIDNVFKPATYAKLELFFKSCLDRGFAEDGDLSRFHPFLDLKAKGPQFEYDGYVYSPLPGEEESLKIFYSLAWNQLFSQLFGQPTGFATSLGLHHHPPGNRTGFVHHDYAMRVFPYSNRLENGVYFSERTGGERSDKPAFGAMRAIALLIYLCQDGWHEGDGGGTGLYEGKALPPHTIVSPVNNRLLAFQISPKSFHAFQANRIPRNCIVQWLHVDPWWCRNRYGHL